MKIPFRRSAEPSVHPKNDEGSGDLKDYGYDFVPRTRHVTIQLAESDPHQDLLTPLANSEGVEAFVARRTSEEERTDAPLPVRLFVDGRPSGPVGLVPRGLESVVLEGVYRLEAAGRSTRIPVTVTATRNGLRVTLLMGKLR